MLRSVLFFWLLLWTVGSPVKAESESNDYRALRERCASLLRSSKFDQLELTARSLKGQVFPSGRQKLQALWEGLLRPSDGNWQKHLELLNAWVKQLPRSGLAQRSLGSSWVSYAWDARGGGYASTVTDEGWKEFEKRLLVAKSHLDQAEKLSAGKDPYVYVAFLILDKGLSSPRKVMEKHFQKGVSADPRCGRLYLSKAEYLLPRWYGETGDVERFAREASASKSSEGPGMYARIASLVAAYDPSDLASNGFQWSLVDAGYIDLLRRHKNSTWILNEYAFTACCFNQKGRAREQFLKIGNNWEKNVWQDRSTFDQARAWALE